MANRFPLIFNSGAGQIQELAASDNLDLTSSNLVNAGILSTSSGSVTAPSLQIGSGTTYNPGLYSPGTDQLAVATNGTERLFVDASGRVGIDTSTFSDARESLIVAPASGQTATFSIIKTGSTSANSSLFFGDTDSNNSGGITYEHANDAFAFRTNGTEKVRITSGGLVGIGSNASNANGGILQLSGGITFPATAVAASDANTLDDYEEGTWTPVVTGWTSVTYTAQDGKYIKIGKHLTAWFYIQFSGTSAATDVTITGLPFTEEQFSRGGSLTYYDAPVNATSGVLIYPAAGTIRLYNDTDAGTQVQSNGNASGAYLIGSINSIRS